VGKMRNIRRIFIGKPEGKGSLGSSRLNWEDNIKMNVKELSCVYVDWIQQTLSDKFYNGRENSCLAEQTTSQNKLFII
jgi:hypothetical protein